jgi:hypothetical protein
MRNLSKEITVDCVDRHNSEEIDMMVQVLKVGVKIGLPVLIAALALPAFAAEVTFTTTGDFICGAVVGCSTSNGGSTMTITNAQGSTTVNVEGDTYTLPAGSPAFDDVNVAQFTSTATRGSAVSMAGASFQLNFSQTGPTAGSGDLVGTFSGTMGNKSQTGGSTITFGGTPANPPSVSIGSILYSLDANSTNIGNPGIGTTGANQITATVTPEPTFMLLTGLGFAGLAFVAYRRRRIV